MFKRIYIEITNTCNLNCSFCIGTKRQSRFMNKSEFSKICEKIKEHTKYIYLHVMGEPLLHPELADILEIANSYGFAVNVTTNGTLLGEKGDILLSSDAVRKVSVSLHSFEGNDGDEKALDMYLFDVIGFAKKADCIVALRLWNDGGADSMNGKIVSYLDKAFETDISALTEGVNGIKIADKLYLEHGEKFDWPSLEAAEQGVTYCHGLSQQIAILCDGTVVPCCLDSDGTVALGNIFEKSLDEIVNGERAQKLKKSFSCRKPCEELCRRCGYASRFGK